nr:carbon storage regulator [uncultured Butyricicoccus sp.]
MLILQRRKGESVQINHDITITIADIRSDRVRLAISAPREVPIKRSELLEAARINQAAAHGDAPDALLDLFHTIPTKES